jgi:predicted chitinase
MPKAPPVWRIFEIRSKGRYIGFVFAASEKEAIEKAIEEFGITEPHRRGRLFAQREA